MEAPIIPICKRLIFASVLSIAAAAPAQADAARRTDPVADYMQARVADADGDVATAIAGYARALAARPGDATVALRAYRQALAAGDIPLATRAAAVLRDQPGAPADLALLPLALAAARNDAAGAEAATQTLARTPLAVMVPSLRAWIAYAAGRDPAPAITSAGKDPVTQRLAAETAALLQIARGDTGQGLKTVQALRETGSPVDLRLSAAQLLFGTGHADEARALLAGNDPALAALRQGAAAKPTLAYGVSRLLARVAGDLVDQDVAPLSIALTRTALIASPANDRARLLLAQALAGEDATDQALATLDAVPASSPFASTAVAARISILARADRTADALALARRDAERADAGPAAWQLYADQLSTAGNYAEAARWYRRIAEAQPTAWNAWLQYGGALEQAGDWPAARAALQKAVALAPAEPLALNYLGYAQAERRVDVPASIAMLERAHAAKPDDASIADSLGWALFVNGDTTRALPLIERAAEAEPTNAEIAEHLGDVYWALGRRYEARYAWRAAALTAPAQDAAALAARIAQGPPAR
ncbi:tetratricopeptide repeat protein [Sphingomonas sp. S6]|uniref:tetratricopeptide repeat protein n=1 Tax=Sphingomonas sp. S6 TaxID=3368600 RepID=UPI0028E6EF46|nr:tetratricopeptide repeat protein [uncultured Sphingomonas sp.]